MVGIWIGLHDRPVRTAQQGDRQHCAAARPSFLGQLTPGQFEALILEPDGAIEQPRLACTAWNEVAKNVSLRPLRSRATWENAAPHSA